MPRISPLSCIDPKANIADDVVIGPFCVVGPNVTIGSGCVLLSHVVITAHTTLGKNNQIFPNVVLGGPPQDKKYKGDPTRLEIGDDNQFREGVTLNIGTTGGGGVTRVGNHNMLMASSHMGHDAQLGDHCVLANNVMIAGHVHVGSFINMMGGCGIHHFVTVGDYAYIGGGSRIRHDVPPFMKVDGDDQVRGLNSVGLRRGGFSQEEIESLEEVCRRLFYRRKPFARAMAEFDSLNGSSPHIKNLVEFLKRRDLGKHGRYLESLRTG
jgi:UDP-N-acetylglucosamine acyltransferase